VSYHAIARHLNRLGVPLTHESVRLWCKPLTAQIDAEKARLAHTVHVTELAAATKDAMLDALTEPDLVVFSDLVADEQPDVIGSYLARGWTIDSDGVWHEPVSHEPVSPTPAPAPFRLVGGGMG
jgi:hypothetical protein